MESNENIDLLIILINKILCLIEKENRPFYIDIINKAIKEIQNTKFIKDEIEKKGSKEIYNYYKNTIEYITKKKNQNHNSIYETIIIK